VNGALPHTHTLAVYAGPDAERDCVGHLHYAPGGVPLDFLYADTWLARDDHFSLSPALAPERLRSLGAAARQQLLGDFLRCLLPSGEPLSVLANHLHRRRDDTIGLLQDTGFDTFGALRFGRPPEPLPNDPFGIDVLRPVSPSELSQRILDRDIQPLTLWDNKAHASLPGDRHKLAIHNIDGRWSVLTADRIASTHLIKLGGVEAGCSSLTSNELLVMRLAAAAGVATAPVTLQRLEASPVLVVQRFDRQRRPRGDAIRRIHAINARQLLGLSADRPQPVPLDAVFAMLREHAVDPAKELRALLRWSLLQVFLARPSDASDLAFVVEPGGKLRLAPAYALRSRLSFVEAGDARLLPAHDALEALKHAAGEDAERLPAELSRMGLQLLKQLPETAARVCLEGADRAVINALTRGLETHIKQMLANQTQKPIPSAVAKTPHLVQNIASKRPFA